MSEIPACPSFPRRREPSPHSHSTGFPPARERLVRGSWGVIHGAIHLIHGAIHPSYPSIYLCLSTNFVFSRFLALFCGDAVSLGIFGKGLCTREPTGTMVREYRVAESRQKEDRKQITRARRIVAAQLMREQTASQ